MTPTCQRRGLLAPYTLSLPATAGAPYPITRLAERASEAYVIYVEPLTEWVLQDVSSEDIGMGARRLNGASTRTKARPLARSTASSCSGCIGVVLLAISAPVLWWKRRRAGRLQVPPRGSPQRARGLIATMAMLGILYPLTGVTMLLAAAADRWLRRGRNVSATLPQNGCPVAEAVAL